MNNLQKLHTTFNQSPWIDNLTRELLQSGRLQHYIDNGVRGMTSNPTILEKAIIGSDSYDQQIAELQSSGLSAEDIYWKITEDDIKTATNIFRPLWEESNGTDGYVSLEVSPRLAADIDATADQGRQIWRDISAPNLMVKVPATNQGIPVVQTLLSEGINVNVTLLFSLEHYRHIVQAHLATHKPGTHNNARSVASFFVSRVDSEVDARLEAIGSEEALSLRGQAAIAQAHIAYSIFLDNFAQTALLDPSGIDVQRLLWASTSTKNPDYDDLLYVRYLLAPYTINTLPEDTIEKIIDHLSGDSRSISYDDIEHAKDILSQIENLGISMEDVAKTLETQGVQKFNESFNSLLQTIDNKKAN